MNLLDTGIIIDNLEKDTCTPAAISTITVIEVLREVDYEKRLATRKLLEETFSVLNLDNDIIEAYCRIYCALKKECNLLPDADLLIAATAIAHDLTLETKDASLSKTQGLMV